MIAPFGGGGGGFFFQSGTVLESNVICAFDTIHSFCITGGRGVSDVNMNLDQNLEEVLFENYVEKNLEL